MRPHRTFLSVIAALLLAVSLPAAVTAHSSRMEAIRQLPISIQAEREAQLHNVVAQTGALGTYWDKAADQMIVTIPSSGKSSFKLTEVGALGLDVRVETRDIEPADIADIENLLRDWKWDPSARGTPFLSFFDARKGKVVIASDAAPTRFDYFLKHFPGKVEYAQSRLELDTRQNDGAPHWGGAELDINGSTPQCTSGFTVKKGSSRYMLSASHCFAAGQSVNGGNPNHLSWGSVRYVGVTTDTELIGGSTYEGWIYVGTTTGTGHAVRGAADPVSWHTYCVSGMKSGEGCGHTYNGVSGLICWGNLCWTEFALFSGGKQTIPGDSGSPWYFYDPNGQIYVAGVHTGLALIDGVTYMVASRWSRIVNDLGVSIVTG